MKKSRTISIIMIVICMALSIICFPSVNAKAANLIYADYYTYSSSQTIPFHYSGVSKSNKAWIGVYKYGVTPGDTAALAWKYVSSDSGVMNFASSDFVNNGDSPQKGLPLARGKYVAYLFKNGMYDYIDSYTFWIDSDDPILRFDVISDLHVMPGENYKTNEKLKAALSDIKNYNNAQGKSSALIVNGDAINSVNAGYNELINNFSSVDGDGKNGTLPSVFFNLGNHELMDYTEKDSQTLTSYEYKKSIFAEEIGKLNGNLNNGAYSFADYGDKPYYKMTINNNHFFFLASEDHGHMAKISKEQLNWINQEVYKISKYTPNDPIFVFMHESFKGTTAGSEKQYIDADTSLRWYLNKYPTVTLFTSHTHEDVRFGKWVHQESKSNTGSGVGMTIINTSSVGDIWKNYEDYGNSKVLESQGLHVDVYNDSVVVRARDFINGKWIKEYKIDLKAKRNSLAGSNIG